MTSSATVQSAAEQGSPPAGGSPPDKHAASSSRITSSAIWAIIARGWSVAATAALGILLRRWFGDNAAACGEAVLFISLVGIAAMIASFGLPETMIRLVASRLARGEAGAVRLLLRRCSLLLLGTSLTTAVVTATYYYLHGFALFDLPGSPLLAVVVAAGIVALSWQMVDAGVLRGLHDAKWANLLSGGQSGGPIAVTLLLVMLAALFWRLPAGSVTSPMVAQLLLAALLITTGITVWRLWRILPPATELDGSIERVPTVLELAGDTFPIALSQVAAFCTLSADLWLTGSFLGTADVAYYGSAKQLVLLLGVPEQLAMLTIIAIIPDLYARGQLNKLQRVVRQAVTLAALPAIVAAVGLVFAPTWMLATIYGESYSAGGTALVILTLGQLTANCLGPCGYVLLMTGRRWTVLAITLSCGIAAIVLGTIGATLGGMTGLAIAAASCTAAQIILEWMAARWLVGIWCHASPTLIGEAMRRRTPVAIPVDAPSLDQDPPL
jgi:O-antigen/teichoic acid export membrane protein